MMTNAHTRRMPLGKSASPDDNRCTHGALRQSAALHLISALTPAHAERPVVSPSATHRISRAKRRVSLAGSTSFAALRMTLPASGSAPATFAATSVYAAAMSVARHRSVAAAIRRLREGASQGFRRKYQRPEATSPAESAIAFRAAETVRDVWTIVYRRAPA